VQDRAPQGRGARDLRNRQAQAKTGIRKIAGIANTAKSDLAKLIGCKIGCNWSSILQIQFRRFLATWIFGN
jgi:hypothetical protein